MAAPQPPQSEGPANPVNLVGTNVGRFSVRARLGAGGMGEVYRAVDTRLRRDVALKRVTPRLGHDPKHRQRFLREAERASGLADPHVAGIYDVFEETGETFLVMEYVEGETLRRRLKRERAEKSDYPGLEPAVALSIVVQCARALVAAHKRGIVHCDLKPENIMITPSGQVKILDFGVARQVAVPEERSTVEEITSQLERLGGTPAYMAPEVLMGEDADERADIFSLGVVLYELLAGHNPFVGDTLLVICNRVLHEDPRPLRDHNPALPESVERVVRRMLVKDRARRYPSAADLLEDLLAIQGDSGPELSGAPLFRPSRFSPRRAGIGAIALVGVAAVFLIAVPTWRELFLKGVEQFLPIPARKHIVVLPFTTIGDDPGTRAFCDGLTYVLTSKLGQIEQFHESLSVVPASEVVRFGVAGAQEARQQFGVRLAVTGSVQRAEDRVILTASLIDTVELRQLRSIAENLSADDLPGLQVGVALRVAEMLELELQPRERRVLAAGGTTVARAHDYYVEGRGYLQEYSRPENIENAVAVLRRALELDPGYALAHAGLGEAYWLRYQHTRDPLWVGEAEAACQRAAALEEILAAPHVCLGTVATGTGRHSEAVEHFQRAIDLAPKNDDAQRGLARAYENLGQLENAESAYGRAIRLRPDYWAGYNWLAVFYFNQGRYEAAAETFADVVALAPDSFLGYRNLGGVYLLQGRYSQAVEVLKKSIEIRPTAAAYSNLGVAFFYRRDYAEAAAMLERAVELNERDAIAWANLGEAYHWLSGGQLKAAEAYGRAAELFQERLDVNERDAVARIELAICHAMLGRLDMAREYALRAALESRGDPQLLLKQALIEVQARDEEAALEFVKRALEAGIPPHLVRDHPAFDSMRSTGRLHLSDTAVGKSHP